MRPATRLSTAVPAPGGRRCGAARGGIHSRRAHSTAWKTVSASRGRQTASGASRQIASDSPQAARAPAPGSTPTQSPCAVRHLAQPRPPSARQRNAATRCPRRSSSEQPAPRLAGGEGDQRAVPSRRERGIGAVEGAPERGEALGIVRGDLGPIESLRHPLNARAVHLAPDVTMRLDMGASELAWLSAQELAQPIRGKELSPVEVMSTLCSPHRAR